jgi:hypothetical protein
VLAGGVQYEDGFAMFLILPFLYMLYGDCYQISRCTPRCHMYARRVVPVHPRACSANVLCCSHRQNNANQMSSVLLSCEVRSKRTHKHSGSSVLLHDALPAHARPNDARIQASASSASQYRTHQVEVLAALGPSHNYSQSKQSSRVGIRDGAEHYMQGQVPLSPVALESF